MVAESARVKDHPTVIDDALNLPKIFHPRMRPSGKQGFCVPFVVHEDVQVPEHVRVEQVGFVEQKHRMHFVAPQFLHLRLHG